MLDDNVWLSKLVTDKVKEALLPWNPGRMKLVVSNDLDRGYVDYKIILVTRHPHPLYSYHVDPRDILQLTPADFAVKVADAAFRFYRYRPALPIDDHIVLGEN